MKLAKATKLQLYSFIASMPVIDVLLNYILYKEELFKSINVWLISFPLIFVIGIVSWKIHVVISNFTKIKFPELAQTRIRILIMALCIVPFMSLSVTVIFFIYAWLGILNYQFSWEDFKMGLLVGFAVNIIFETLFEADYMLGKYKESLQEKETFQALSIAQEFDALKSQVNPHFLFNCFNTLSSLITEDKQQAETFLNELSKVYRYLLRNNEDGVSTVENEIKFIQSYFKLLQTRHGDGIKLNIQVDKRYYPYLLPSLSLQLLVENVVKHNIISRQDPLVIDIFTTAGNKLVINNNIRRRSTKVLSNKVGLENIRAKYLLLKQHGYQVMDDSKNFTVVLPLIWNNNAEIENSKMNKISIANN